MSPSAPSPHSSNGEHPNDPFDYSFVNTTARIAVYDDLRSAPRITEIFPAETGVFIENLASGIYNQARALGGSIPYTVVREVSENFIHARFREIIVSIMDNGNTIRFADQGPGIVSKDKAQLPGFSSAIEPMKNYIRGVGSGLPIVREYLEISHGSITIEDNLNCGSVVTISLVENNDTIHSDTSAGAGALTPGNQTSSFSNGVAYSPIDNSSLVNSQQENTIPLSYNSQNAPQPISPIAPQPVLQGNYYPGTMGAYPTTPPQPVSGYAPMAMPGNYPYVAQTSGNYQRALGHTVIPHLSENSRTILRLLCNEGGPLRITDITEWTGIAGSSVHKILTQLEEQGLIARDTTNTKLRTLTDIGYQVARALQE